MSSELDKSKRLVAAPRPRRVLSAAVLLLASIPAVGALGQTGTPRTPAASKVAAPSPAPRTVDFAREIRPILSARCGQCHESAQSQGGLRLDSREAMLKGGASGPAVVPKSSGRSLLVSRLLGQGGKPRMPLGFSPLSPAQIARIRVWIDQGAAWDTARAAQHWAYARLARPRVPAVRNRAWVRNPIDAFVLARLEREHLHPSGEADRTTLLRRVTLDLTGLPPTPQEVDAFLADRSPGAYERVVDRLLASPRYGERMALPWLDAARYADSNGFQQDGDTYQYVWRDWVVKALNEDMPFDQFTIYQLAGDLLPNATYEQKLATAFNRLHMLNGEGGAIAEEQRNVILFDRVDVTATNWLGLTMACAQCHDHKYDPITQKDYYSFMAFFNNVPETGTPPGGGQYRIADPWMYAGTAEERARLDALEAKVTEAQAAVRKAEQDHAADLAALREKLKAAEQARNTAGSQVPRLMIMSDARPRKTHILLRGNYEAPGEQVQPNTPAFLPPMPAGAPKNRLGLAQWLVSPENPLTARVQVNRYWQFFSGTGLVKTSENFGKQSEPPSHPKLLDWLAAAFVATTDDGRQTAGGASSRAAPPSVVRSRSSPNASPALGWSIKKLVRLIVTSATYRQSSKVTAEMRRRDPENRLLARGARFRMPSMLLRDMALASSGLLVDRPGGKPVYPYQPPGIWDGLSITKERDFTYPQSTGPDLYRRSLYTFWRRTVAPANMFDASVRNTCKVRLPITSTPLHALTTLNDITWVEAGRALAERVMKGGGATPEARLTAAFRCVCARRPQADELKILRRSLDRALAAYRADPKAAEQYLKVGERPRDGSMDPVEEAAYAAACLAIYNLDEALTRE